MILGFFINPEVIVMEDLYHISINNQHSPVAVKHFGAEELVATLFNISRVLLWASTGPDPGAAAHYVLSSSEMSPDFVLRQPCNGSLCAVNRMTEDLLQKHPPVWNKPTKAGPEEQQQLMFSSLYTIWDFENTVGLNIGFGSESCIFPCIDSFPVFLDLLFKNQNSTYSL